MKKALLASVVTVIILMVATLSSTAQQNSVSKQTGQAKPNSSDALVRQIPSLSSLVEKIDATELRFQAGNKSSRLETTNVKSDLNDLYSSYIVALKKAKNENQGNQDLLKAIETEAVIVNAKLSSIK